MTQVSRVFPWAMILTLGIAGCGGGPLASSAVIANHTLAVTPRPARPITFYEGPDETEPFTPFAVTSGPNGAAIAFGYANAEGASYITTYETTTWQQTGISNGFSPSDPYFDCDNSPELGTAFAPDGTMVARSCVDGSVTVFDVPNGLVLTHTDGSTSIVPAGARVPVVAFAPSGHTMTVTNDGPAGPGQAIALIDTQSWRSLGTLAVPNGLLTRPSWSPDGTQIAAIDLAGTMHIWDAKHYQEIADAPVIPFALGSADKDPAGPGPQWAADGQSLTSATPTRSGTLLTYWSMNPLRATATATTSTTPCFANPLRSPDGKLLYVRTAADHGQIFTVPALVQVADFPLPGALLIWSTDSKRLDIFTTHATVISLELG